MNIINFFKKFGKKEELEALGESSKSKDAAKERLHLVLMQDRANVSVDFLDLMKQEIIDVIKKYIEVDENEIDVRFTNQVNEDGTNGAPALYANIPIIGIKNENVMNTKNQSNKKQNESESNTDKLNGNLESSKNIESKLVDSETKIKNESKKTNTEKVAKIKDSDKSENKKKDEAKGKDESKKTKKSATEIQEQAKK